LKYFCAFKNLNVLIRKKLYFLVLVPLLFSTCNFNRNNLATEADLPEIQKRGRIVALTNYNTSDYFVYNGNPMGFQFELLRQFAEYSGYQLDIVVSNNMADAMQMLIDGKCDIIAQNIAPTPEHLLYASFTFPILQGKQVLVQQNKSESPGRYISDLNQLKNKTVIVSSGTAFAQRLKNLETEIAGKIDVVEVPEDEEQLIRFVAGGEIDYTVCDEYTARLNKQYFPKLDINVEVSIPQNMSWAVRNNSPKLLELLNRFIEAEKKTSRIAVLYNKYYQNQWAQGMVNSKYFVLNSGQLSPYDELLMSCSAELQWDWRLLAAIIYKESQFIPNIKSHRGAVGLMQLMPSTAGLMGYDSTQVEDPSKNIIIGVKYLKWLDNKISSLIPVKEERIKFVLAAYNIGLGHIFDAIELAKKYKKDATKWDTVKDFLLNKAMPEYYRDAVVKFGPCVGKQTVTYVSEVLSCYSHYKNLTPQ